MASRRAMVVAALCCVQMCAIATAQVDYARDVLPIISANCYHCHGPDEEARQMELRLDTKEGIFRVEGGVAVVVAGKPQESELIRRTSSSDPDEVMPPADGIRKLTPAQIETLRKWVEQGAKWGTHWAFIPPQPTTRSDASIDTFIRDRLGRESLAPSLTADRATLIRRVTLDLTGLPPTPEEIDAFLEDDSPDAYERVVDRLLASPRYGERMAADWLDVARYADTHGYQMDRYRPMWPYRDWVIKAFNDNLPFDEFITWQLAGDLLPNATKEQRLATAFNRLHMQNEEGGVVEEEFRVAYVVDRVTTMGTALLGLTFDCSRCHDHKYDPLTQRDFYSMFAFFQNIDESGQTSFFTDAMPTPTLLLSTGEQDAKIAELRAKIDAKEKELATLRERKTDESFERWLALRGEVPVDVSPMIDRALRRVVNSSLLTPWRKKKPLADPPKTIPGKIGDAVELSGENGLVFPGGVGYFTRADPFSLALWLQTPAHAPRFVVVHKSKAPADAASRGYELLLENGRVAFGLHHFWPGNSLKVVTQRAVAIDQWTHVAVTYDGSSRAAGVRIFIDGEPAEFEIVRDGLTKDITYGSEEPNLAIGFRFRDNGFKGGKVDAFRVFDRALTFAELRRLVGDLSPPSHDELREYYFANQHPAAVELARELTELRRAENELVTPIPEAMVMEELGQPKKAFILQRGAYDAPLGEVTAATPAFLPPFPGDQPRNRLGLAKWLLDSSNPLTARVIVNRAWQQMFGRGIVETTENLGTQGAQPAHPELLDYLACLFAGELNWDMKRLLKTIALSATYRQSSRASGQLLQRDPDNVLLARGPARRLTAEMLRDQALAVSGLLVEKIGGPSVKPYQPEGLWDVAMGRPTYEQDKGEGLYRRSLYTFWKRTVPPPAMMVLDAADKSNCTVRRQSTSTPLQALVLLNDVQIVEAARFVAQRALREGGATTEEQIAWTFRLITGRAASAKELKVLKKLHAEQLELFTVNPESAKKLLAVGEKKNDKLDQINLAAGTVLAIAVLNHDNAVMRR